eukprot:TRINITY_DN21800_c0_g1_i1.p1 TRINITY_DN21800_c0_g1~~TRINITY_DN21800_c0_g1_i1.p1  ORF type:complete len:234 (-),score=30.01 TRINITY_DN21800_c0_g1_i1:280-981(-)
MDAHTASAEEVDDAVAAVLCRARSGTILELGAQGSEGSAGWRRCQPLPTTLLLHDLSLGSLPSEFGATKAFANVVELDLSGNALVYLPDAFCQHLVHLRILYLAGPADSTSCNKLKTLPQSFSRLTCLEDLSLHDNALVELPPLIDLKSLQSLRLDRNPLQSLPGELPQSLRVLHLEGCTNLGGSLENVHALPEAVRALQSLDDLQLPDGGHIGTFFGTPLQELLTKEQALSK